MAFFYNLNSLGRVVCTLFYTTMRPFSRQFERVSQDCGLGRIPAKLGGIRHGEAGSAQSTGVAAFARQGRWNPIDRGAMLSLRRSKDKDAQDRLNNPYPTENPAMSRCGMIILPPPECAPIAPASGIACYGPRLPAGKAEAFGLDAAAVRLAP
ncbi:MAG: hypothetical protein ACHQAY_04310 [Hyphomicrobiales bacterium]